MDDTAPLSLFEQLQHRIAGAAEPLEALQQLGVLTHDDLEGFI